MNNTLIFASEKEVRFGKLLKFIIPTYLTSRPCSWAVLSRSACC